MDGTVLVADDDRTIRTVLTQALTRAGCKVHATASLVTLTRWVEEGRGDLVITDVMMPDGNGLELLPQLKELRPELPVIVISAQNTIMTAIQATEAHADDYLPKPFDLPDLMKRSARALAQSTAANRAPTRAPDDDPKNLPLVGHSPVMQDLYQTIARVLHTDIPVLVSGESGTGKSLIAHAIHDLSDRRNLPFVNVKPHDLTTADGAESIRARSKGGTISFEEIGDFSIEAQAYAVRLLDNLDQTGTRVMATSQMDLAKKIETGDFRQDLFYRLAGVVIDVPPLRDRVDDISDLVEYFLATAEKSGLHRCTVDSATLKLMSHYTWPGNVRQLENIVYSLAATSQTTQIRPEDVEAALKSQPTVDPIIHGDSDKLSASVSRHLRRYFDLHGGVLPPAGLHARVLKEVEYPLIEIALEATGGNQAKCADLLGLNRNTLRKKITELDIRVTRRRKLM